MYSRKLEGHSLWAWMAAGFFAPMAWYLGSAPWRWSLALGAGAGLCWLAASRVTGAGSLPKWAAPIEYGFLIYIVSRAAADCGACWITAQAPGTFRIVLLLLAACSAAGGCRAGARCGAVLFWFAAGLLALLAAFALPEVQMEYLRSAHSSADREAFFVLLLPFAALLLPRSRGSIPWFWALLIPVGAGVTGILSAGILSPAEAARTPGAFFCMARGISILGVAERFEAAVAAALTISWFCLMSLLLTAAGHMGERLRPGWGRGAVWLGAIAAWGFSYLPAVPNPILLSAVSLALWVGIPVAFDKIRSS